MEVGLRSFSCWRLSQSSCAGIPCVIVSLSVWLAPFLRVSYCEHGRGKDESLVLGTRVNAETKQFFEIASGYLVCARLARECRV